MMTTARSSTWALLLALSFGCGEPPQPAPPRSAASALPLGESSGTPAELEGALELPDPYARARALGELIPKLGADAIPYAKHTLENFRLELGPAEFDLLLRFWATLEPREAVKWALNDCPDHYRHHALGTTVEILARVDPTWAKWAATRAHAESYEMGRVGQIALIQGWYHRNPEEVFEFIHAMPPGVPAQRSLFAYCLSLVADQGGDAAAQWVVSLPDDEPGFKQVAYQQVMSALTWADPPAAVRFCDKHCGGRYAEGLRVVLARARINRGEDGGDVVEWAARFPGNTEKERELRDHGIWVTYTAFALKDRDAAVAFIDEWLEAPERPPWLNLLLGEYGRYIGRQDPVRALELTAQMEPAHHRPILMARIARHWHSVDEEAAEAWLSESGLDESWIERIRDPKTQHYLPEGPNDRVGLAPPPSAETTL